MSSETRKPGFGSPATAGFPSDQEKGDAALPATTWSEVLHSLGRSTLDVVFPPMCLCCLEPYEEHVIGTRVCERCDGELQPVVETKCPSCGLLVRPDQLDKATCFYCRDKGFRFDHVLPYGTYVDPLRHLIIRMKKDRNELVTREIGNMFAKYVHDAWDAELPDVVAAVPLHWTRKWSRGTHASAVLARLVARDLRVPVAIDLIACRRRIRKQATLLPDERRVNVRGAFEVVKPTAIRGKHVLVTDDVMTTGATLSEIARVLKRAKARKVTVAVVARGVGDAVDPATM